MHTFQKVNIAGQEKKKDCLTANESPLLKVSFGAFCHLSHFACFLAWLSPGFIHLTYISRQVVGIYTSAFVILYVISWAMDEYMAIF